MGIVAVNLNAKVVVGVGVQMYVVPHQEEWLDLCYGTNGGANFNMYDSKEG